MFLAWSTAYKKNISLINKLLGISKKPWVRGISDKLSGSKKKLHRFSTSFILDSAECYTKASKLQVNSPCALILKV